MAPDTMLETALKLWGPRLILGGIDVNDFEATVNATDSWETWMEQWCDLGMQHLKVATEAEERRHDRTAGEAYCRASAAFHFAKFVWVLDGDRHREATLRSVTAANDGLRLLDPTARLVSVAVGNGQASGVVRYPRNVEGPAPLVVLVPGLDSTKEEFRSWEAVFLERGLATLTMNGLGQGEAFHSGLPLRSDYERTFTPLLDAVLAADDSIDPTAVGVAGTSLGGRHVIRVAAFDGRIAAVASISAPASGLDTATLPPHSRAALAYYAAASSPEDAAERGLELDVLGLAERVEQPTLCVTGKLDRLVPWSDTEQLAKRLPNGRFVLYEVGNHGCTNVHYLARPLVADWIKACLRSRPEAPVHA